MTDTQTHRPIYIVRRRTKNKQLMNGHPLLMIKNSKKKFKKKFNKKMKIDAISLMVAWSYQFESEIYLHLSSSKKNSKFFENVENFLR